MVESSNMLVLLSRGQCLKLNSNCRNVLAASKKFSGSFLGSLN